MKKRREPRTLFELTPELKRKVIWFRARLRIWFSVNKRNFPWRSPHRTPSEILVAEILLRRTRAETVAKYYDAFLNRYPDFHSLSKTRPQNLERMLKPMGLWRQKTPIFLTISKLIENQGYFPQTREELEDLFHIGDYIASVILSTFFDKTEPFIDVNMARVVDRFFGPRKLVDIRHDPYLHALARRIVNVRGSSLDLNWAVLDFAALICNAGRPLCEICPMTSHCQWYLESVGFESVSAGKGQRSPQHSSVET